MECGSPPGGWQSRSLTDPIPVGDDLVTVMIPEAHTGSSEGLFTGDWRDRLRTVLPEIDDVVCIASLGSAIAHDQTVGIWQLRLRAEEPISPARFAQALSSALTNPNACMIVEPDVYITAIYASHEIENPYPTIGDAISDIAGYMRNVAFELAPVAILGVVALLAIRKLPAITVAGATVVAMTIYLAGKEDVHA